MALIHQLVLNHIPPRHRQSSKGWIVFDAVCCHHRGHDADKRKRGNLMMSQDEVIGYNCYNCGFKTKFDGYDLSKNFEQLMHWLNIPYESIKLVKLDLLNNKLNGTQPDRPDNSIIFNKRFNELALPPGAVPLECVAEWDDIPEEYLHVVEYLGTRGAAVADNHPYHWSPSAKNSMHHRLIIPFYHRDVIVGWTARYAGTPPAGVPRYYNSELQPGYLFNVAALDNYDRKYALLLEGPLDAIAVDGVGALGSELSPEQLLWLRHCDKEIIVVPDRQRKNQGLIDIALEHGWSVSFPEWEDDVKDAAQASSRYGRIYTIRSILDNKTNSPLQIGVKRQMFKE